MLNFGNKEFRNLQEQVLQNANDLETIKQSLGTALPNPIAGPQGPAGQSIVGPQGERGSIWTVGTDFPASPRENDIHLKNSEVYQFTNGKWVLYSSIRGTQGIQGIKGNTGDIGPIGPVGPIGPQGLPAPIYTVRGRLTSVDQLPSPDTVESNTAYIVGALIYGLVKPDGESAYWSDLGLLTATHPATAITYNSLQTPELQANNVQDAISNLYNKTLGKIHTYEGTFTGLGVGHPQNIGLSSLDEVKNIDTIIWNNPTTVVFNNFNLHSGVYIFRKQCQTENYNHVVFACSLLGFYNQHGFDSNSHRIATLTLEFGYNTADYGNCILRAIQNITEKDLPHYNIENGTGTNAVQMKQDVTTIDYTGRNPNATTIDSTITGTIEIGAKGAQSATFGKQTTAMNLNALAEGNKTIAKGEESHAEGYQSVALGNGSHAEGNITVSSGACSHSEGNNTIAGGEISHAEGYLTKALAEGSHTEGNRTISNYPYQTIVGMSNDNKEDTLFEVGNGSTDGLTKSNAFQVHKDGHAEVLTVGETENSVVNLRTLNQMYAEINEKLEGKKNTVILSYNWDLNYLKTLAQSTSIKDGDGNDISQDIIDGDYDDIELKNIDFNSNADKITSYTYTYYYLILVPRRYGLMGPSANQYVLIEGIVDGNIVEPGSVILVLENDVPDRWLLGYADGFCALESRKYEIGATNLTNGRDTTISVQGGTGSIANYDGDIAFGTGLETTTENQAVFGSYNKVDWTYANGKPLLSIGNGTAQSRHTAFEVYNNNSIRIGDTILTEQQLIALLSKL